MRSTERSDVRVAKRSVGLIINSSESESLICLKYFLLEFQDDEMLTKNYIQRVNALNCDAPRNHRCSLGCC